MELLVQPVVVAVNQLDDDSQHSALTAVISAFCEAWSSNILTRKIRFRYSLTRYYLNVDHVTTRQTS